MRHAFHRLRTYSPKLSSVFHRCTPVSNPGQVVADILLTAITAVRNTGICNPADVSDRYSHTALIDMTYKTNHRANKLVQAHNFLTVYTAGCLQARLPIQTDACASRVLA